MVDALNKFRVIKMIEIKQNNSPNILSWRTIRKTYLYNFDPLKPHFYIIKLGFTGVYIIFLISAQKQSEAVLTSTHNLCFEQKYEEYQNFVSEKFLFLVVEFSVYLNRHVFVMLFECISVLYLVGFLNSCTLQKFVTRASERYTAEFLYI